MLPDLVYFPCLDACAGNFCNGDQGYGYGAAYCFSAELPKAGLQRGMCHSPRQNNEHNYIFFLFFLLVFGLWCASSLAILVLGGVGRD